MWAYIKLFWKIYQTARIVLPLVGQILEEVDKRFGPATDRTAENEKLNAAVAMVKEAAVKETKQELSTPEAEVMTNLGLILHKRQSRQ